MTREDIIRMVREAGAPDWWMGVGLAGQVSGSAISWLERFAELVAAADREACAKVCDGIRAKAEKDAGAYVAQEDAYAIGTADECAATLRARGR